MLYFSLVPLNYQWSFSEGVLDNDDRVSGLTSNTLTITEIAETDNGTYTCTVMNDHGTVSADALAIVISKQLNVAIYIVRIMLLKPSSYSLISRQA